MENSQDKKAMKFRRRVPGTPPLYLQSHVFKFRSGNQLFSSEVHRGFPQTLSLIVISFATSEIIR
jgi:hypothetical protein